jgi:hypothetical protein
MSEHETEINVPPVGVSEDEAPARSISYVDLLKQDMQALTEAEEAYIKVPGYEKSGLQVKYRLPESGMELDKISRRVNREYKETFQRNLYNAIDMMIYLCEGLYVQPEGEDEPIPFDPEGKGHPVYFDDNLATVLNMNGAEVRPRNVVKKLFNGNDFAIVNHAERLNRWLMDTSADLETEFWQSGE